VLAGVVFRRVLYQMAVPGPPISKSWRLASHGTGAAASTPAPEGTSMSNTGHAAADGLATAWTPDLPDARDHLFSAPRSRFAGSAAQRRPAQHVPARVQPGADRQLSANAIGPRSSFETTSRAARFHGLTPCSLLQRACHGGIYRDRLRRQIVTGFKSVANLGVCPTGVALRKKKTARPHSDGTSRPGTRPSERPRTPATRRARPPRDHVQPRPAGPGPDEGVLAAG